MSLLLALLLTASPPPTALKLAAPGLTATGVDPAQARFFNDYLVEQLRERGLKVVAESEVAGVLGLERQRQLLGCTETSSDCMAEMAGALGVDGIIHGSLARLGNSYAMTLKVFSSRDGEVWASASTRGQSDEQLAQWLAAVARRFADRLSEGEPAAAESSSRLGTLAANAPVMSHHEVRVTLLGAEYSRRLGGSLWGGGRARLAPLITGDSQGNGARGELTVDLQALIRWTLVGDQISGLSLYGGLGGAGYTFNMLGPKYLGVVFSGGAELRIFRFLFGAEVGLHPAGRTTEYFMAQPWALSVNLGYAFPL